MPDAPAYSLKLNKITPAEFTEDFQIGDILSSTGYSASLISQVASNIGGEEDAGSYNVMLNRNAKYLDSLSVSSRQYDTGTLSALEVLRGIGYLSPYRELLSATDISCVTQGVALSVERTYNSDLLSRNQAGSFGYGWSFEWDRKLTSDDKGNLSLTFEGGKTTFFLQTDGSFFSSDDSVTLTKNSSGYLLTSKDGTQLQYATDGSLRSQKDANGNTVTATYSSGKLTKLSHSNGQYLIFTRNSAGYVSAVTDAQGNKVTYTYDSNGNLTAVADQAAGTTERYTYANTTIHSLTSLTAADGTTMNFSYGADGLLSQISARGGENVVDITYGPEGKTKIDDSQGGSMTYCYDERGRLVKTVDNLSGLGTEYMHGDDGTTISDSLGNSLEIKKDAAGRITSLTDGDGNSLSLTYDSKGNIASMMDMYGNTASYTYDSKNNLTRISHSDGTSESMTYNSNGTLATYKDVKGITTSYTYNTKGQVLSATRNGNTTSYSYDADGNLASVTYADSTVSNYQYDSQSRLSVFTDVKNNAINYTYDTKGNMTAISRADGTSETFSYNAYNDLTTWTNRRGGTVKYTYDASGDLTKIVKSDGTTIQYAYDAQGRLTQAGGMTFTYDAYDNLKTQSLNGKTLTYQYDSQDRIVSISDGNTTTKYSYTVRGDLDKLTNASGALLVDYDYDAQGRLSKVTNGNGTYSRYTYNQYGELTAIDNYSASGSLTSYNRYTYDSNGRCATKATKDGTWTYTYDKVGQLTSAVLKNSSNSVLRSETYQYDTVGNRVKSVIDGVTTTYVYDAMNRIVSATVGGKKTNYRYDADGNLLEDEKRIYTWTTDNRVLTEKDKATGQVWTYGYDALGNRISSTTNGVTTTWAVDANGNVLAEYVNGVWQRSYIQGGSLAGWTDRSGNTYYFSSDLLGSMTAVTDKSGKTVNTYSYDSFGNVISANETVYNAFQYVGGYGLMQNDSGTIFVRARNYDPNTGRWISEDPIGIDGGENLYVYCGNDGVDYVDVEGELPTVVAGAVIGGLSSLAIYAITSALEGKRMTLKDAALATAGGALSGAIFGLTGAGVLGNFGRLMKNGGKIATKYGSHAGALTIKGLLTGKGKYATDFTNFLYRKIAVVIPGRLLWNYLNEKFLSEKVSEFFNNDFSLSSVTVSEPKTGTAKATFTISLKQPSDVYRTFFISQVGGTATAGQDFQNFSGQQVVIAPGQTSATFSVTINSDNEDEGDEYFGILVTTAENDYISKARCTICDNSKHDAVVAVIDRSGSMAGSRITSAKQSAIRVVNSMADGDYVGVVAFNSNASTVYTLNEMSDQTRTAAISAINGLSVGGNTYIGAGLEAAANQLSTLIEDVETKSIILMSDGQDGNPSGTREVANRIRSYGYDIYGIGYGSAYTRSISVLQEIVEELGGKYYFAENDEELERMFFDLAAATGGRKFIFNSEDSVTAGKADVFTVTVDSTTTMLRLGANWKTVNALELIAIDPDGNTFTTSVNSPLMKYSSMDDESYYEISAPTIGTWAFGVIGADGLSGTENYTAYALAMSPISADLSVSNTVNGVNQKVTVSLTVKNDETPITGATAHADILRPDGTTETLDLYDDGKHGDGVANDGVYANFTKQTAGGVYKVTGVAEGELASGDVFRRQTVQEQFKVDSSVKIGIVELYSSSTLVDSDMEMSGVVLQSGGNNSMFVSEGGVANNTVVSSGGRLYVLSNGTAVNTMVSSGGGLTVSSGGTANSTTVDNGGHMVLDISGIANFTTVNYGGSVSIYDSGIANFTTVNYGGSVSIYDGGIVNYTTVGRGGCVCICFGIANSTTVNNGGYVDVSSGGIANYTTVNNGGHVDVSSGGTANYTTVGRGGWLNVSSGGTANSTTVSSGVWLNVSSGGIANNTFVNKSGTIYVSSGGIVNCITVSSGGTVYIRSGGTMNSTTVNSGGYVYNSGGTLNSTTISSGGYVYNSGGTLNSTTISSGGYVDIYSGGIANSTTVSTGGYVTVYSNGIANSTTVSNGGYVIINRNGIANSTTVSSGGNVSVTSGGTALNVINSGGNAIGVVIGGDTATVLKGRNADGTEFYISNGVASNIHGGLGVSNGGIANSTTVNSGVYLHVSSGGMANRTTVSSGGYAYVSIGGIANYTTIVNGGYTYVYNGGIANYTTVVNGGYAYVCSGGIANSTTVSSGGYVTVYSNGIANSTTVSNGGYVIINRNGIANSTTVSSGGNVSVTSGGTALNVINSGGNAIGVVIGGDTATVLKGRNADGTVFYISNGVASNIHGGLTVSIGGIANSTTVNSGCSVYVSSGGTALNVINSGGNAIGVVIGGDTATVLKGRNADGTVFYISNGVASNIHGGLIVSSGGTANSTTVNSGCSVYVFSGGTALNVINTGGNAGGDVIGGNTATILKGWNADGTVFYISNGVASNIHGNLAIYSGGMANSTTVVNVESVYVYSGGTALNVMNSGGNAGGVVIGGDVSTILKGRNADGTVFYISNGVASNIHGGLAVYSGGTANSATAGSGGYVNVFNAGIANFTTVSNGGYVHVSSGGIANSTTLNSNGHICVYSNGTVNRTTVNRGGYIHVSSGGTANSTIINSGGSVHVYIGGIANSTTVTSRGWVYVSSGGVVSRTIISSGGNVVTYSGGTVNSTTVNSGGNVRVYIGGMANSTIVASGGRGYLYGVANGTIISNGGYVEIGGTANSTTVSSGGSVYVYRGGTVNSTTVSCGGIVSIDGTALHIVEDGGYVFVATQANVTFVSHVISNLVLSKGSATLHSGTTAASTTIHSDGTVYVYSGGIANDMIVNNGGRVTVYNGGATNSSIVDNHGSVYVSSGGTVNSTTISSAGSVSINIGGTANSTTVSSGGCLYVGGTALRIVEDGGYVSVTSQADVTFVPHVISNLMLSQASATLHSGTTAVSATISSDGHVYVYSGGIANNMIVSYGGNVTVYNGGIANSMIVNSNVYGYYHVVIYGVANSTTISSGGTVYVHSGGTANGTIVSNSGWMVLSGGGSANNTTVSNGGYAFVYSGCRADNMTVSDGGKMRVSSGGTALNVINSDGNAGGVVIGGDTETVLKGRNADGTIFYISNGVASNVHGGLTVSNGGIANDTTVSKCGIYMMDYMHISSGGTANRTNVMGGGGVYISSGGTVNSTTVSSGGSLYVTDGGTALHIVEDGGYVSVASQADVTFTPHVISSLMLSRTSATLHSGTTAVAATICPACDLKVFSGGMANSTAVNGGRLHVFSGGTVNFTSVSSNGCLYMSSGGMAVSVTVSSGGLLSTYQGAAILNGSIVLGGEVILWGTVDASRAAIVFDVAQRVASDATIINDITKVNGGTYSVNVYSNQANGRYKLAGYASTFDQTVTLTVKDTDLTATLTKDVTTTVGGKGYTLNVVDDELCLTVITSLPAPGNLSGNSARLSWAAVEGASGYVVEYSKDNFATVVSVETVTVGMEHYNVGAGTWQWRVRAMESAEWAVGNTITISSGSTDPSVVFGYANGVKDAFFVKPLGTWSDAYRACHMGVHGGWEGTDEKIVFSGENRFGDLFQGSTDENVLLLTDDANGDALFVYDIYTDSKDDLAKYQARLANIKEIRAGAGNDIVDLTSDQFDYVGGGLSIHGGLGNDTIWANNGNNTLFGDAGNDRIVGAGGNDVIVGGSGNDSMHGGGGDDIFAFGGNWGKDSVEQLADGKVTLWFENGSSDKWNASTLTYTDGDKSVRVSGVTAENVTLKFGDDGSEQYGKLLADGAFRDYSSERIFESKNTRGMLA